MTDIFGITIKGMKARKLRSYLTVLGIVIGITTIVALISLGDGLQNAVSQQFNFLGADTVTVFPANLQGPPAGSNGFNKNEVRYLENRVSGIDYSYYLLFQFAEADYKNEKAFYGVNAFEMENVRKRFEDTNLIIDSGRYYSNDETGIIVIGSKIAIDGFSEEVRVGNKITIKNRDFRVVGILKETGGPLDERIFMSSIDVRDLFDMPDTVNSIVFKKSEGRDLQELKANVQQAMEDNFDEEEFDVNTQDDLLEEVNNILGFITGFLVSIAFISIVVGAVGIMNSMYTSVLERTKEIGIMKAIGATNGKIAGIFTIESGILGLIGGLIGTIIGLIIAFSVQLIAKYLGFDLISIRLDPIFLSIVLFSSTALGIIFGILPAIRASKQQPVKSLRYE